MGDKYGGLNARNILIRHKLMEKKRFDSADYYLNKRKDPLRIDVPNTDPIPAATALSPGRAGAVVFRDGMDEASTTSPRNRIRESKYGKLGVANLLMRRKLNKQHFDSADYSMESSNSSSSNSSKDETTACYSPNVSTPEDITFSPVAAQKIVARHSFHRDHEIFDSADYYTSHQLEAARLQPKDGAFSKPPQPTPSVENKPYGKLCARNILLRKKLAEKKRFDSADYFTGQTDNCT